MLGRASGNPPPSLPNAQIPQWRGAAPVEGQQSSSKPRQRQRNIECHQTEPNSVLDIRTPSPSSAGAVWEAVSDGPAHRPQPNERGGAEGSNRGHADHHDDEFQIMGGEDLASMLLLEPDPPAPDQSLMRRLLGETEDPCETWDAPDSQVPAGLCPAPPALLSNPGRLSGLEPGTCGFYASNPFGVPADVAAAGALPPPLPPPPPFCWSQNKNVFFPGSYPPPPPAKRQRPSPWQQSDTVAPLRRTRRPPQFQTQQQRASFSNGGSDEAQLAMVRQLIQAAEAVEVGGIGFAQAILARLNRHLSPLGKPLHRAAFYFGEALSRRLQSNCNSNNNDGVMSPMDIVRKVHAYRSFSEASPLARFANFTANQALLESLRGAETVHIVDFEIGLGGQWASFLQEIGGGSSPAVVRLSAVGSTDSLEMHLTRESLCGFARDLNIAFEFNVVEVQGLERLTPAMLRLKEGEAIAVNFSLGMQRLLSSFSSAESMASLLCLLKQLSPKAIVVVDDETLQNGVSFAQQFLEALQFYAVLFDSLDATGMGMDTVHSVEKFLLAPKIGNVVAAKCGSAPSKRTTPPPWRSLFRDGGLSPMDFSNFAQTQAEHLVRSIRGRGFEVIKADGSLLLVWQGKALVAASVWSCC